jgi:uncharacterized protein (DUF58 family)
VRIEGGLPAQASAGHVVHARVAIESLSRRPAYDVGVGFFGLPPPLTVAEPTRTLPVLAGGARAELSVALRPERRGLYQMPDLEAYTTFPFHFHHRRGTARRSPPLLVVPSFQPLADLHVPVSRRYQPGGIALTSNIGESPEYIGNRDYRPGDPTRRIDFRSWARLARPVVREFQEEYYCRVALVLDTFVPPGRRPPRGGFPGLEAAVSLCAAIADALTRGEYVLDVFAAGPELYVFRAGRHIAHFDNLLEILACVEACRRNPFDTIAPAFAEALQNVSTVIGVFLDWDDARERFMRAAVEAGSGTKLVLVRPGAPTREVGPAEAWTGPVTQLAPEAVLTGKVDAL